MDPVASLLLVLCLSHKLLCHERSKSLKGLKISWHVRQMIAIFMRQSAPVVRRCSSRRQLFFSLMLFTFFVSQYVMFVYESELLVKAKVRPLWHRPPDVLLKSTEYTTSIDMWGVGCILFEMATGRPMFPGSTIPEELLLIFRSLGSPTEDSWPGISNHKEYAGHNFPIFEFDDPPIAALIPRLDPDGLHLLQSLLRYDPTARVSASDALKFRYFDSLGPQVHKIPDTVSIFALPGIHLTRDPGSKTPPPVPPHNNSQAALLKNTATSQNNNQVSKSDHRGRQPPGEEEHKYAVIKNRMSSFQLCANAFHSLHSRLHSSASAHHLNPQSGGKDSRPRN